MLELSRTLMQDRIKCHFAGHVGHGASDITFCKPLAISIDTRVSDDNDNTGHRKLFPFLDGFSRQRAARERLAEARSEKYL